MTDKNRDINSPLFRQVAWGVQHDAFEDQLGQRLLLLWKLGVVDDVVASELVGRVQPLQVREAMGELSPFRKSRLRQGELVLGDDAHG